MKRTAKKFTRKAFTAETATQFERRSPENAAILNEVASQKGCNCEPYKDWFTYQRWQALGQQVQKGEKSTRVTVYVPVMKEVGGKQEVSHAFPKTAFLFCRCQVKGSESAAPAVDPDAETVTVPSVSLGASFAAIEL